MSKNPPASSVHALAAAASVAVPASLSLEPYAEVAELLHGAPITHDDGRFHVVDADSADWLLGKLADFDAEEARIVANTQRRVKQIQADRARLLNIFGEELKTVADALRKARRRQEVTLSNGRLVFREVKVTYRLVDEAAALADAEARGLIVTIPEVPAVPERVEVDAAAYVKWAKETGEVLAGLEKVPAHETFKINAGTKEEKE